MSFISLKSAADKYNQVLSDLEQQEIDMIPSTNDSISIRHLFPKGGYSNMIELTEEAKASLGRFDYETYSSWVENHGIEPFRAQRFADESHFRMAGVVEGLEKEVRGLTRAERLVEESFKRNPAIDNLGYELVKATNNVNQAYADLTSAVLRDIGEEAMDNINVPLDVPTTLWQNEDPTEFADKFINELECYSPRKLSEQLTNDYHITNPDVKVYKHALDATITVACGALYDARAKVIEKETPLAQEVPNKTKVGIVQDHFDALKDSIEEYTKDILAQHGFTIEYDSKNNPYIDTSIELPGMRPIEQRQYIPFQDESTTTMNIYDLKRLPEGLVAIGESFNPVMYANQVLDVADDGARKPGAIAEAFDHGVALQKAFYEVAETVAKDLGINIAEDEYDLDLDLGMSVKQFFIESQTIIGLQEERDGCPRSTTNWEEAKEKSAELLDKLSYGLSFSHITTMGEDEIEKILVEDKWVDADINDKDLYALAVAVREAANAFDVMSPDNGPNIMDWDKARDCMMAQMENIDSIAKEAGLDACDFQENFEIHNSIDYVSMYYDGMQAYKSLSAPIEEIIYDKAKSGLDFLDKYNALPQALVDLETSLKNSDIYNSDPRTPATQELVDEFRHAIGRVAIEMDKQYGIERPYTLCIEESTIAKTATVQDVFKEDVEKVSIVDLKKRHLDAVSPKKDKNKAITRAD